MTAIEVSGGFVALVDDADVSLLAGHRWYANPPNAKSTKTYAFTTVGRTTVYMHRLILNAQRGQEVDHINGDGLDNRRANLRLVSRSLNEANKPKNAGAYSSRFKGVSWDRANGRWQAYLHRAGRKFHLGYFRDEAAAAEAYDKAASAAWGDHALLNFPEERAA